MAIAMIKFGFVVQDKDPNGAQLMMHHSEVMNKVPPPKRGDRVSYVLGTYKDKAYEL